jgi:predicted site-specific integrase-resolvase
VEEWIPAAGNLRHIQRVGMEQWLSEQRKRQELVEGLIQTHTAGRSMSLYCKAGARMPIRMIHQAIKEAEREIALRKAEKNDTKEMAKTMKTIIQGLAVENGLDLN